MTNISLLINVFRSCWMHNRFHLKIYKVVHQRVDLLMEMSGKSVFVKILENCFWHQLTVIAESARFVVDVNQHEFWMLKSSPIINWNYRYPTIMVWICRATCKNWQEPIRKGWQLLMAFRIAMDYTDKLDPIFKLGLDYFDILQQFCCNKEFLWECGLFCMYFKNWGMFFSWIILRKYLQVIVHF